jgi:hypothetical protein
MTAQTILPANTLSGGYDVDNSLRFGSNTYLTNTFGSAPTLATKNTMSVWFKRSTLGTLQQLMTGNNNAFSIVINTNDTIAFYNSSGQLLGPRLYRDTSAWMHFVFAYDSTQGTDTNRFKVYINGVLETSFNNTAYPSQNAASDLGANGTDMKIGTRTNNDRIFEGYIAETAFVDGQALGADSFGEFDEDSGIWKPIDISGLTFGNNGFYLENKQSGTGTNSSGMGADTSGNDFHFAVTNLTAVDQSTDTCTNNFATLNPLNVPAANGPTFAEGNLKTTCGVTGAAYMGSATIGVASGKWYAETKVKTIDSIIVGVSANATEDARDSTYPGAQGDSAGILLETGNKYINDSGTTHGDAFNVNDILMIALDLDNNNVYFGRNGNWFDGSGNADESSPNSAISLTAAASTQDGFYFFSVADGGGSAAAAAEWNFGSPMYAISSGNADGNGYGNFEYAVPSGYYSLNTKNLAEYG